MSVHTPRLCLVLLLAGALLPGTSLASEVPQQPPARAHASKAVRAAYGITMLSTGAAMLPITVESIIAGQMEPGEAPGFLITAALLGLGGIPIVAEAAKPLSSGALAGPRARVRLAREGVLAYAIFGSMFTSIGVIATAVTAAKSGEVPVDLRVFDIASAWMLFTAVGMAADGDLARMQLPASERRAPTLDHLGGPLLAYGLILMTLVTPALRLSFHDNDLPLQPTLLPTLAGITLFAAGLTLLVANKAQRRSVASVRASAPHRLSIAPLLDPSTGTAGMALVGRF